MKDFYLAIKWMAGQARPFIFKLFIIIVLGAALSLCGVSVAIISKGLIDAATSHKLNEVIHNAIFFVILIPIQIIIQAFLSVTSLRITELMSNSIRQKYFTHILQATWMDTTKYHSEDLLTRLTSDINIVVTGIAVVVPSLISLGIQLLAAFITLFYYEHTLAIFAFILAPFTILLSRIWGRKLKYIHIKMQETESKYRAFISEAIQNIIIIKAFANVIISVDRVKKLQDDRLNWATKRALTNASANSILSSGYWVGYLSAFIWGVVRLFQGTTTFGTLTAFFQLVEQIQSPFMSMAYTLPQIISSAASSGRLKELDALEKEIDNRLPPRWNSVGIKFKDVSFGYEKDKYIIRNAFLNIEPGEIVAFIGPSGQGKTTIIRLILSLISADKGKIYFTNDCEEDFEVGISSRSLISYVPQGNTLLSGTIEENLRLGCYDAGKNEIEAAARAACAWDFIEELPNGLNTNIGERGIGLSEGQSQRIAIARALLNKAPILILDEATSALDANTEAKVIKEINNFLPGRTCIVITHRPISYKICNRIFKLEDGRLYEEVKNVTLNSNNEAV